MKNLFAVSMSLLLCLAFTGCNDKDDSSNSAVSSSSSTSDDSSKGGSEVKIEELAEVEAKISPLIDKYYSSMKNKSYDDFSNVFPVFYMTALEEEFTAQSIDIDDFMKSNYDYFVENYGSDFDFSYEIEEVLNLDDDSVSTCEQNITNTFGKTVDITKAYGVTIIEHITGSEVESSENGTEMQWLMFEIDGTNYLYETYYES